MANKTDLVAKVAELLTTEEVKVHKKDATPYVDAVVDAIVEFLAEGESVEITKFGRFEIRERSARKGRNPQTGEEMEIAASKSVGFKKLKRLNDLTVKGS